MVCGVSRAVLFLRGGLTAGQFSSATINTAISELAIGAFFKNGDKCDANVLLYCSATRTGRTQAHVGRVR